jgi:hypothetical protein
MEQTRKRTVAQLETTLVILHRREMRLRSALASTYVSPENRKDAREALEVILQETRVIERAVLNLEQVQ